jgi:NAD(P) transhydrogenase
MGGQKNQYIVDLNDEVVRGAIILNKGNGERPHVRPRTDDHLYESGSLLWPPPPIAAPPPPAPKPKPIEKKEVFDSYKETRRDVALAALGMGTQITTMNRRSHVCVD